jgi:hypothetical protein
MPHDSYWLNYTGPGSTASRIRAQEREALRVARESAREAREAEEEEEDEAFVSTASDNMLKDLSDGFLDDNPDGVPGDVLCEYAFGDGDGPQGRRRRMRVGRRALDCLVASGLVERDDNGADETGKSDGAECYRLTPWFGALLRACDRVDRDDLKFAFDRALLLTREPAPPTLPSDEAPADSSSGDWNDDDIPF